MSQSNACGDSRADLLFEVENSPEYLDARTTRVLPMVADIIEGTQHFRGSVDPELAIAVHYCLLGFPVYGKPNATEPDRLAETEWRQVQRDVQRERLTGPVNGPETRAERIKGGIPEAVVTNVGEGLYALILADFDAFVEVLMRRSEPDAVLEEVMRAHADSMLDWLRKWAWNPAVERLNEAIAPGEAGWKRFDATVRGFICDVMHAARWLRDHPADSTDVQPAHNPVVRERRQQIEAWKDLARSKIGFKPSDDMIAPAANSDWKTRTPVTWWKANNPSAQKGNYDMYMQRLLWKDPAEVWPELALEHQKKITQ